MVSHCYPRPKGRFLRVTHPSATKSEDSVRLACVRHTASVHPEPGSNSPLCFPLSDLFSYLENYCCLSFINFFLTRFIRLFWLSNYRVIKVLFALLGGFKLFKLCSSTNTILANLFFFVNFSLFLFLLLVVVFFMVRRF